MGSTGSYSSLPAKAAAVSSLVVSTAVMLHFYGPSMVEFASSEIPKMYGLLISWLTPPYLYFVINGIIISIAASSRFHSSGSDDENISYATESGASAPVSNQQYIVVATPPPVVEEEVKVAYVEPTEYGTAQEESLAEEKDEEEEDEFVISRSSWTPKRSREATVTEKVVDKETVPTEIPTEYSFLTEKPLASARLGRRKSLKNSPEGGKALGVARPKRNDTLESTWRAITDGRAVPLARHLKKSDTWETHHTHAPREPEPVMRKCETFKERGGGELASSGCRPPIAASPLAGGGRLRKEPSLGQDDLNRRVEAFIKKFNEEMRLQRQESFKHYLDMINRGTQ